jgi:hypothetical protein
MSFFPEKIDPDRVPLDIEIIRGAILEMHLLPSNANRVVLSRSDYERLVQAAGNLAAGSNEVLRAREILGKLVTSLEGLHIIYDDTGVEETIAEARAILPKTENSAQ